MHHLLSKLTKVLLQYKVGEIKIVAPYANGSMRVPPVLQLLGVHSLGLVDGTVVLKHLSIKSASLQKYETTKILRPG